MSKKLNGMLNTRLKGEERKKIKIENNRFEKLGAYSWKRHVTNPSFVHFLPTTQESGPAGIQTTMA